MGATSSLPLKNLIRLVAPDFWGNPLSGNLYWGKFNYTETALYFGVFPLILLLVSLFSPRRILSSDMAPPLVRVLADIPTEGRHHPMRY